MSSSPAKRRRSNSSRAVAVNASNTSQERRAYTGRRPSLNRASFQSPTKASLARSHPEVLSRVLSRSSAERARRSANYAYERETIDGGGEEVSGEASGGPSRRDTPASREDKSNYQLEPASLLSPGPLVAGLSPTRGPAQRPQTTEQGQPHMSRGSFAANGTALAERHASGAHPRTEQLEHNHGRDNPISADRDYYGEPELPPTPTELGLERPPGRPKGLLSSSPSWRHEMRRSKRRKAAEGLISSPIESKGTRPIGQVVNAAVPPLAPAARSVNLSDEVKGKQKLRDRLVVQLERLQGEVSELEYEALRSERPHDYPFPNDEYLNRLRDLLSTTNPSCAARPLKSPDPPSVSSLLSFLLPFSARGFIPRIEPESSPPPPNPFAIDQPSSPIPYLTLFAPLSLAAHTSSISSSAVPGYIHSPSSILQRHDVTLSAPSEFPAFTYHVPITVYTDPGNYSVIAISVSDPTRPILDETESPSIPDPLRSWLDSRLSNPLLKLDISGLCWGICRYWEAAVSRAKFWARLENLLSRIRNGAHSARSSQTSRAGGGGENHVRELCAHLDRSSFLFSFAGNTQLPQLLVSCTLSLDIWTSEPQLQPDICITSRRIGEDKLEREIRKVFWNVLKNHGDVDADGLMRAVETVVTLVFEVK